LPTDEIRGEPLSEILFSFFSDLIVPTDKGETVSCYNFETLPMSAL
jgi:hypothetical protein